MSGLGLLESGQRAGGNRGGHFNALPDSRKGEKFFGDLDEQLSVKGITIPEVSYLRIYRLFNELFLLALLFEICRCERSINLDAS
jgi:hypothetical protein